MTTIWSETERHDQIRQQIRRERFTRLVAAYNAAMRWELYNSARLFENKLTLLGAWRDDEGSWRLDELLPSRSGRPF